MVNFQTRPEATAVQHKVDGLLNRISNRRPRQGYAPPSITTQLVFGEIIDLNQQRVLDIRQNHPFLTMITGVSYNPDSS